MNRLSHCGSCGKAGFLLCSRCQSEYYCSKTCQFNDFTRHRITCFPLPALLSSSLNNDDAISMCSEYVEKLEISSAKPEKPDATVVKEPTVAQDPSEVAPVQKDPPLEPPMPMESKIPDDTASIVSVTKQQQQPQQQSQKPRGQKPAFDQGIRTAPPNSYNNNINSNNKPLYKNPPPPIETVKKDDNESDIARENTKVLQVIRRNQQSVFSERPIKSKDNRVYIDDMKRRTLKNGKSRVSALNGSLSENLLYVCETLPEIDEYLMVIDGKIKEFLKNDKTSGYKPAKNEMVLAKFEDMFYRAVCKEIRSNTPKPYHVFFVDYGNSIGLKEEDIKPFGEALKGEIVLHTIKISNLPKPITKEVGKVFDNEDGFEISVESCDENGIYSVRACAF